jgi:DNA-binding transcriptional ArsR family regulator
MVVSSSLVSDLPTNPGAPESLPAINADTVFAALGDPARRRILQTLADGQPRSATALAPAAGKRFDATLKHLVALRQAGFVVSKQDPTDGRRQAYTLAPSVRVATGPEGRTMDFGYCVVRLI